MASLKRMRARTDDIKVEWGDEAVIVTWRPGMLTDRFMERLAGVYEEAQTGRIVEAMPKVRGHLAELIASWDLTYEDGPMGPDNPMVPINSDSLADIPEGLLLRITGKILDEAQEGEVSGRSGSGGQAVAPSAISPPGSHSFG
jgi:hypothetical protein